MLKFVRLGAVVALMAASTVWANDTASMREEIADLRAKVASLETAEMAPSASGEAASLTSMRKKGSITIGGDAEWPVFFIETDDNVRGEMGEDDEIINTYAVPEMALRLNVQASKDMALKVKLDLEDTVNNNDLLEEMYFNWKNVGGSPISLNLGKKEVPFGADRSIGYHEPFVHGGVDAFDNTYINGAGTDVGGTSANQHTVQPLTVLPGEMDNTVMIEAMYAYEKLLKVNVALFQNGDQGAGPNDMDMHEDRPEDTMFFQSFAGELILTPIEGLELSAGFMNVHNDSYGDKGDINAAVITENDESFEDDSQALSLAFAYEFKGLPVEVFGEYIHGWDTFYSAPNQGGTNRFDDRLDTDTFQLGMIWGVTENIDLGAMVEYATIDNDDPITDNNKDGVQDYQEWEEVDFWQAGASVYYNFDNGMYMGVEYYHAWMDADLEVGTQNIDDDYDAEADILGFVMGYSF